MRTLDSAIMIDMDEGLGGFFGAGKDVKAKLPHGVELTFIRKGNRITHMEYKHE